MGINQHIEPMIIRIYILKNVNICIRILPCSYANSKRPNDLALILPRHNVELFHQTLVQHCCENVSAVEDEKANQKIVKHIVQRRVS